MPTLVDTICERYDPKKNAWEEYEIKGAHGLAAFGWTPMGEESGKMLILGGTDGDVI